MDGRAGTAAHRPSAVIHGMRSGAITETKIAAIATEVTLARAMPMLRVPA
jgi:hypothetical protein